ncbi:MAG: signal peptidase I [Bacteroidales bacterium]|nr:signal peptidase I [Bacteroidales bacterium]
MIYDILLLLYFVGPMVGLWFIFKKAGVAPWKAVVPLYNLVMWIKVCGKSWKWYIYFLVPAINIFTYLLLVVETAKVFRRYGFWEQLLAVLLPWVYLPIVGLSPKLEYHDPNVEPPAKVSERRDWLDSIVFAIVAAMIIRSFTFELYNIPSSSMEGSLMTGDYLLVSKLAYGPRATMTPLAVPLVHNTLPLTGERVESYLSWLQLPYHRYPGYSKVKRYDAVVFNFPEGDTTLHASPGNQYTYYDAVRNNNQELLRDGWFVRPLDRKTNYIKRCIGMPGETLQIVNQQVLIDGKPIATPKDAQTTYGFVTNGRGIAPQTVQQVLDRLGLSYQDIENAGPYAIDSTGVLLAYDVPLNSRQLYGLERWAEGQGVRVIADTVPAVADISLFPHRNGQLQSVDNFGPVHIPAKGEVLELNDSTLPMYRRLITVYEHNTLEVKAGKIYVNGEPTDRYTVKQNYYWMMGDNRHHSQDCRYWGFVPEDHIVGKAKWVLFSRDKDRGNFRKGRWFIDACAY